MIQKPITVVVSDLHLGGGASDPGDDHVYQGGEFIDFLNDAMPESRDGQVELFINGDFLEFAQVLPDVYTPISPRLWCSEEESLEKLNEIIKGHEDIFAALADFAGRKNAITIAAGNHDVDLWWPLVQQRLKEVIGEVEFATGEDWFYRYGGRLVIGHGHQFDPANRFKRWKNPILPVAGGAPRLEMCAGTLLMVKFINSLEEQYPFADNLKPLSALARLLYAERRSDFYAALWTLGQFAGQHTREFLSADDAAADFDYGESFITKLDLNEQFAAAVTGLYKEARGRDASTDDVRNELRMEDALCDFLAEVVVKIEPERWAAVLDIGGGGLTLGVEAGAAGKDVTLSAVRSGLMKDKEALRRAAKQVFDAGFYEVVVCGHTHQPDEWRGPEGKWAGGYFNPGSWTRYVDAGKAPRLTMDDLKREEDFPFELNYIWVEETAGGNLRADKVLFKRHDAKWS